MQQTLIRLIFFHKECFSSSLLSLNKEIQRHHFQLLNTFVESEKINGHDPFFRPSNQRRLNCRNDERPLCFDSQLICRRRRRCQMILFLRDVDDDSSTAAGLPNENHYLSPINLNRCLHDKREHELRCGHQKGSKDVWKMVGDMKALQRFRENSS